MRFRDLIQKGFSVLTARVIGALLAFLIVLTFAKLLGPEQFGQFSLALTIITILGILSRWGLEQVVLKQVASNLKHDPALSYGYVQSSLWFVLLSGVVVIVLLLIASPFLESYVFKMQGLGSVVDIFAFSILAISILYILAEAFKSVGMPTSSAIFQSVLPPLITLVLSAIQYYFDMLSLERAVCFFSIGFILSAISVFIYWNIKKQDLKPQKISRIHLLKQGWPMLLISSGALIMAWSDIVVAGIYLDEGQVGIYSVATKIVMITSLLLIAVNSVTAPKYASMYKRNNIKEIKHLAQLSSFVLILLAIIPSCFILFYSDFILGWLGEGYISGSLILITLLIGQFINVACGSVGSLLTMTGHERYLRNIILSAAAVNIALSVFFVQYFGLIGIALATSISMIGWNIWAMFIVRKHLGFWTIYPSFLFERQKTELI